MKEKEITLLSVPFFFNLADLSSGNVTRTWTLNGKTIEGREKEAAITFRQPEEEGASQITVTVNNATKVLQSAQGSMLLKFNKTNTSQQ
jgi:hypothetical protein